MKKLFAIALVLVMMLSCAVFVSAEETDEGYTVYLQLCEDFSGYWPNSYDKISTTFSGEGTCTISVNIAETFGTSLDAPVHLYLEIVDGWENLQNHVVSDLKIVADGVELEVDQSKVYTYESQSTTDWVTYFGTGRYCIEINNIYGYSAAQGSCIDVASFSAAETLEISFTMTAPAAEVEPVAIADGQYVISNGGLTFAALAEDKTYGYPTAGDASALVETDYITITNVGNGQFTMQDCYGRYIYMKGTYNSFNVDAEMPTEGYLWVLEETEGGLLLKNVEKEKYLAYSEQYTSWGCYASLSETSVLTITAVEEEPIPNPGTGDMIFAVLSILAASGMGLTAIVSKKK